MLVQVQACQNNKPQITIQVQNDDNFCKYYPIKGTVSSQFDLHIFIPFSFISKKVEEMRW